MHRGHIAAAEQLRSRGGLREVWLLPNARPPHRTLPIAGAADRLQMVRLAVAGHHSLRACDLEVKAGGVSYTLQTLDSLANDFPGEEFIWLVGYDAALLIAGWYQPDAVLARARFAVFNRAGAPPPDAGRLLALGFPKDRVRIVRIDSPAISAHEIRVRLSQGLPVEGMLPPSVLDYIHKHGLYQRKREVP